MRKPGLLGVLAIVMLGAAPAQAISVLVETENGVSGHVEVTGDNVIVRACNENENTPAGDSATGYIWVNPKGEPNYPAYGNGMIGAGDADGEGADKPHDCP